jgi:hypothetical protein
MATAGRFCSPVARAHELLVHNVCEGATNGEEFGRDVIERGRDRKTRSLGNVFF